MRERRKALISALPDDVLAFLDGEPGHNSWFAHLKPPFSLVLGL